MKEAYLVMLLIICVLFHSCVVEDKCYGSSCSDQIEFQIVDKPTKQDIVFGLNRRLQLDSMQLNKTPDFKLGIHDNYLNRINGDYRGLRTSTGKGSVDTSYLRLTYNDIDTLVIGFSRETKECCTAYGGYGKITSIKYNGQLAQKVGENYLFEK